MKSDNRNVNFCKPSCQTTNISAKIFGLADPQDKTPAIVMYTEPEKWVVEVENRTGIPLNFTAVDNCIEIFREDGQMENRCDGIITGGNYLIFVELKDQRGDWIQYAVENQLKTTIRCFKENCETSRYRKQYAYVCNKRHPQFQYSHMSMMDEFRKETGVRLCIVNKIVMK